MTARVLSLCAGYGGLDLAAELILDCHLGWYSEIEDAPRRLLAERFPDAVDVGDLTQITDPPPADIVTAGFPCQPASTAGSRKGIEDDRWLWPDIERLLGRMERPPTLLLLENVSGLLTVNDGHAMADVIGGLAGLGFVGSWRRLRASDVGACHRRQRLFIAATHPERGGIDAVRRLRRRDARGGDRTRRTPLPSGPPLALSEDPRTDSGDAAPDPCGVGREGSLGQGPGRENGGQPAHGRDRDARGGVGSLLPTPTAWLGRQPAHSDLDAPSSVARDARDAWPVELTDVVRRLLPTPTASDGTAGPDLARAERPDSGGMDLVTTVERLLPTPTASDHIEKRTTHAGGNPTLQGSLGGLSDVDVERHAASGRLLPTPVASDSKDSRRDTARTEEWTSNAGRTLLDAVLIANDDGRLLPTPTAAMGDGGNINRSGDRSDELLLGGILRNPDAFGEYAVAVANHALAVGVEPPPACDDRRRLNPAFVEWMMMLPAGWITGLEFTRTEQLKMLGNGVVPFQAAAAYTLLLDQLETDSVRADR